MNLTQTVRRRRGRTHPATLQSTDRRGYPSDSQQKHTRSPCNTKAPKSHRGDSSVHFIQQKSANLPAASAKGTGEFSHPIGPSATSCLSLFFSSFSCLFFFSENQETWSTLSETRVRSPREQTAQPDAAITRPSLPVPSASSYNNTTTTFRRWPPFPCDDP